MTQNNVHERFFMLLRQMPGASKEELVWQYSDMLTTSLKEFYQKKPEEYKRMIADLQVKANTSKHQADAELKRLRSSILLRLQKHGVDTTNWGCVNTFLQQPRISGKRLYEMTADEMKILLKKLESILAKDAIVKENELKSTISN